MLQFAEPLLSGARELAKDMLDMVRRTSIDDFLLLSGACFHSC
jgi:hypothetical protein